MGKRFDKPMFWVLTVTWKRRKGKPQEVVGLLGGGLLNVLLAHQQVAKSLNVPLSWVDFKLHTKLSEVKRVVPAALYARFKSSLTGTTKAAMRCAEEAR